METPRHSFGVSWCQPRWYLVVTRIIVASVGQQCQSRFHVGRVQHAPVAACRVVMKLWSTGVLGPVMGLYFTASWSCSARVCRFFRLIELLGGSWSIYPPRSIARREFVGLVCLAELLGESWSSCQPRIVVKLELVDLSTSLSRSA